MVRVLTFRTETLNALRDDHKREALIDRLAVGDVVGAIKIISHSTENVTFRSSQNVSSLHVHKKPNTPILPSNISALPPKSLRIKTQSLNLESDTNTPRPKSAAVHREAPRRVGSGDLHGSDPPPRESARRASAISIAGSLRPTAHVGRYFGSDAARPPRVRIDFSWRTTASLAPGPSRNLVGKSLHARTGDIRPSRPPEHFLSVHTSEGPVAPPSLRPAKALALTCAESAELEADKRPFRREQLSPNQPSHRSPGPRSTRSQPVDPHPSPSPHGPGHGLQSESLRIRIGTQLSVARRCRPRPSKQAAGGGCDGQPGTAQGRTLAHGRLFAPVQLRRSGPRPSPHNNLPAVPRLNGSVRAGPTQWSGPGPYGFSSAGPGPERWQTVAPSASAEDVTAAARVGPSPARAARAGAPDAADAPARARAREARRGLAV